MKLFSACLFASIILLSACNNKATSFLNTGNLQSSFITIDADSSYTLKTRKGSIIKIAAGTFDVEGKINIELKEAFSMDDILLAGLRTTSKGRALQTGGMVYFNATSNKKALDFKKPVDISIPSDKYDPGMQLFKGEMEEDSSIDWVDPQPLDTTPATQMIAKGEAIFKAACSSCHKIFGDFTGPVLAGLSKRVPNKQWVYDFMKSPARMIATDAYAHELFYMKWKPTVMTAFPALSKNDIDAILAYIENEERLYPEKVPVIPCGYDTLVDYTDHTYESGNADTTSITILNDFSFNSIDYTDTLADITDQEYAPKDFAIREGIYSFKITENGWYNIDQLIADENFINVSINARVSLTSEVAMEVYMFLPEEKVLLNGGLSKNNEVLFHKGDKDNQLKLKPGSKAVLLLFGSDKKNMFYAIRSFTIKETQDFKLAGKKTTQENLMKMIRNNKIDDFTIDSYKNELIIRERPCNGADSTKPATANLTK